MKRATTRCRGETEGSAAIASAQPTIETACWLVEAADAGFAYESRGEADLSVVADQQKAVGANAIRVNRRPTWRKRSAT